MRRLKIAGELVGNQRLQSENESKKNVWRTDQHSASAGEFHFSASFTIARCLDGVDLPGWWLTFASAIVKIIICRHHPYPRPSLAPPGLFIREPAQPTPCILEGTLGTFDTKPAAKLTHL